MKLKIALLLSLQLLVVACGNKQQPDQSYIQFDEVATTTSSSTEAVLDQPVKTQKLEEITFSEDSCENNNIQTDLLIFSGKIESLGGEVNDLDSYDQDITGLQKFLIDSGVKNFSSSDFSFAGTKSKMKSCGLKDLTPPKSCWYRTLTLALMTEKIENETGIDLQVTSHYRSKCYNKTVGGSKKSDHITSKAIDFSLDDQQDRHRVEQYICSEFWKSNYFADEKPGLLNNISIGIGESYLHLGIDSTHGRRHWLYPGYVKNNQMPSTCWNKI